MHDRIPIIRNDSYEHISFLNLSISFHWDNLTMAIILTSNNLLYYLKLSFGKHQNSV